MTRVIGDTGSGKRLAKSFGLERPEKIDCALCGKEIVGKYICLDHSHTTLRFRGWLCNGCNGGLGFVEKVGLEKISEYLQKDIQKGPCEIIGTEEILEYLQKGGPRNFIKEKRMMGCYEGPILDEYEYPYNE